MADSIGVQPVHLKSAKAISDAFGVKRSVVTEWARMGAPIVAVGGKYQADYHILWAWLIKKHCNRGNVSSSPC